MQECRKGVKAKVKAKAGVAQMKPFVLHRELADTGEGIEK